MNPQADQQTDLDAEENPVSDMRADFDAAIKDLDSEPSEASSEDMRDPNAPSLDDERDEEKDAKSEQLDGVEAANGAASTEDSEVASEASSEASSKGEASSERRRATKPPISWKGEASESWDKIPEAARNAISEREREIAITMQQTAEERRLARDLTTTLLPHKDRLMGMGYQDPIAAIDGVMSTVSTLATGNTSQRANAAAKIIQEFGIDIAALDDALAAGGVASVSSSAAPNADLTATIEQMLDKRLAPVNDLLTQRDAQQHRQVQQTRAEAETSVAEFSQNATYINDVRNDMADLLDMAAARGQQMTLEQAYDKACMLNPDIAAKVLEDKQRAIEARKRESVEAKRAASATVHGTRSGVASSGGAESLTDTLNKAWDDAMRQ